MQYQPLTVGIALVSIAFLVRTIQALARSTPPWWQAVACADTEEADLDPRVVERLRDLGYID